MGGFMEGKRQMCSLIANICSCSDSCAWNKSKATLGVQRLAEWAIPLYLRGFCMAQCEILNTPRVKLMQRQSIVELLPESVCAVLRTYKMTQMRMLALSRSVKLMWVVQKGQPLPQGRCKLMYCSRGSLWAGLFKGFLYVRLGNTRCTTDVQSRHPRVAFPTAEQLHNVLRLLGKEG